MYCTIGKGRNCSSPNTHPLTNNFLELLSFAFIDIYRLDSLINLK